MNSRQRKMNNTLKYKGYTASIHFSAEDECLVGHIVGINDIVGFHGDSVEKIHTAFNEAVDFYLESCKKSGYTPHKPYSGRLTLRLPSDLHAKLSLHAEAQGKSLNTLVLHALHNTLCKF